MFRVIPNHENYIINESGVIIDKDDNYIRFSADNQGRLYCTIDGNTEYIDYLVAKSFIMQPIGCQYVGHRDGDVMNCHVSNIYWTPQKPTDRTDNLENRSHRAYSSSKNIYEVYNEDESVVVQCLGRGEVAKLIQYEEISLKNMVGNGKKIFLGPYKGFMIRRVKD